MIRRRLLAALAAGALLAPNALAAPVAPDQRTPLDFRRTTLVVRDTDASLKFYRDALGMKVIYDNAIRTPRSARTNAEAERVSRLVFLRSNDDYLGVLGLLEYVKPARSPRPPRPKGELRAGDIVLVFNVQDQAGAYRRAVATPGVMADEAPHPVNYPSYDGKGVINVMFASVYDPDGHYIELNEVLDGLPMGAPSATPPAPPSGR